MYKVGTVARLKGVALGILLRGGFLILLPFISLGAASVNLAWNASTNSGVAGYNVYYGSASGSYANQIPAGTNLSAIVSGLAAGGTYYFAVTAVDTLGNESDFSNEISYSVPGINVPPTISSIANQSTLVGKATAAIPFTINDANTPAANLTLSAVSANTTLVPNGNIVFGGSGAIRTVTITPVGSLTGSAQITISVSDATNVASASFTLTVVTSAPPAISAIADQTGYAGEPTAAIPFTISDADTPVASLALSAASSNPALVPNANVVFGGSGQNRSVTITPVAGQIGATRVTITVSDGTAIAQTSFALNIEQLTALLATNVTKKTYNGLFFESDAVRLQSAGALKLTVASGGKYSGSLRMAASHYSFTGHFGTFCQGTNVIVRRGTNSLVLNFTLKPGDSIEQLAGSVSDGDWTANIFGGLAAFNAKTNPAPYAGSYTLEIPGQDALSPYSLGNSFGSVRVDGSGNAKLAGVLADGSKISQSAQLTLDGTWPLFAPLYHGQGLVMGWISFTNRASDDLHGAVNWIKTAAPRARYYPEGLITQSDAVGSVYTPVGQPPLVRAAAEVQLGLDGQLSLGGSDVLIIQLQLSMGTGIFKGLMLNRVTGKPVAFQGALLQKLKQGYGFVMTTNQSNPVLLNP
jgi:hypothetical protein